MKKRSPVAVFFLPFITFGIYSIVWEVKTKNEMNRLGAAIPTAWLIIIPIVNLYWLYKYCEGVEKVTGGKTSTLLAFVLLCLLGVIGMAIIQNEFNKVADGQVPAAGQPGNAPLPAAQPQPDNSFGGPITTPAAPTPSTAPTVVSPNPPADGSSGPSGPSAPQPTQNV